MSVFHLKRGGDDWPTFVIVDECGDALDIGAAEGHCDGGAVLTRSEVIALRDALSQWIGDGWQTGEMPRGADVLVVTDGVVVPASVLLDGSIYDDRAGEPLGRGTIQAWRLAPSSPFGPSEDGKLHYLGKVISAGRINAGDAVCGDANGRFRKAEKAERPLFKAPRDYDKGEMISVRIYPDGTMTPQD